MNEPLQDLRSGRTQAERSRETIDRLRSATLELIAERGYAGTSTSEVARRAGVSRGALLHHFPRKIDLIADVACHFWGQASAHLRRIANAIDTGETDMAGVVEDMWATVFRQEAARMTVDLFSASVVDPELRVRIEAPIEALFADYDRIAKEAFSAAGLETRQRLALIHVATCALRGLRMQEMMQADAASILAARAALVDLFETYLAQHSSEPQA